ncbi:MAG: hypothetical protein ACYTG7_19515, partial [Planctomycetota bacterium]
YSALDLKLIFNYQRRKEQALAWGFLPYVFGDYPLNDLNGNIRFIQFPGHVVSYWNLPEDGGCEVLPPFLFSWRSQTREDAAKKEQSLDIGPFGLLYCSDWEPGIAWDARVLLIFGFESTEEEFTFDFCGLPLISFY